MSSGHDRRRVAGLGRGLGRAGDTACDGERQRGEACVEQTAAARVLQKLGPRELFLVGFVFCFAGVGLGFGTRIELSFSRCFSARRPLGGLRRGKDRG